MAFNSISVTLAGFTTAKALRASSGRTNSVTVKAPATNEETVYIGGKTEVESEKGAFPVEKGVSVTMTVKDTAGLYASGKAGDKVVLLIEGNIS